MIEYELKVEIDQLSKKFDELKKLVDLENLKNKSMELEKLMEAPDFWGNQERAQKISIDNQNMKDRISKFNKLEKQFQDLEVAIEFSDEDKGMLDQVYQIVSTIKKTIKDFEMEVILSGKFDNSNVFLSIHPGAGGTESQDWGSMLLRMYTRWAEKNNLKLETIEYLDGDEAGIKSVTIKISGSYVYGKLKHESGVHRLVRISPFDSNARRHTSFTSINVTPEIEDEIEIEIKPEDLKIDTYRAGGAGGQHVNKTDSAVRITHLPTGFVVACQTQRSQHQNKATAMQILKAKLYEQQIRKQEEEKNKLMGDVKNISWGNQIRSYVLYPYQMVKDHRTECETSNTEAVLDGDIDKFIESELFYFADFSIE